MEENVLEIFNAMTDEVLIFNTDQTELNQLCNALSIDLQLLKEGNLKPQIYEC